MTLVAIDKAVKRFRIVTQAAGEAGAAADQVLGAAGELSKQAETMRHDVETFLSRVKAA